MTASFPGLLTPACGSEPWEQGGWQADLGPHEDPSPQELPGFQASPLLLCLVEIGPPRQMCHQPWRSGHRRRRQADAQLVGLSLGRWQCQKPSLGFCRTVDSPVLAPGQGAVHTTGTNTGTRRGAHGDAHPESTGHTLCPHPQACSVHDPHSQHVCTNIHTHTHSQHSHT